MFLLQAVPEDDTIFLAEYCVLFGGIAISVAVWFRLPVGAGAGFILLYWWVTSATRFIIFYCVIQ